MGDLMIGRHIESVINQKGVDYLLSDFTEEFRAADYVTANFESPILDEPKEFEENNDMIHLHASESNYVELAKHGFTTFNLANNHTMDYLEAGLENTLNQINKSGIDYIGAGTSRIEAEKPVYNNYDGVKIATLGFTDIFSKGTSASVEKAGVATIEPRRTLQQVGLANRQADLVIVHVHWGEEYDVNPTKRQRQLAKALSKAGADIIIGHHPHVLQPVEIVDDALVFYSMGNFIFDQGWSKTRESAIVKFELDRQGEAHFIVSPILIKEGAPRKLSQSEIFYKKKIYSRLFSSSNLEVKDEGTHFHFKKKVMEVNDER